MARLDNILEFLWSESRFTSYFYQTVRFREDATLPTLILSVIEKRAVLHYNPDFFATLSRNEAAGLLVHEMLHVVFSHNHRMFRYENPWFQNMAQDMVINSFMAERKDNFFSAGRRTGSDRPRLSMPAGSPEIPGDFHNDTGIQDPSWEDVYRWLKNRDPDELKSFNEGLKTLFSKDHAPQPDKNADITDKPPLAPSEERQDSDADLGEDLFVFRTEDGTPLPVAMHALDFQDHRSGLKQNLLTAVQLANKDDVALEDRFFKEISAIITQPRSVSMDPVIRKIRTIVHRFSQSSEWQPTFETFNRRFFAEGIYVQGRKYKNLRTVTVAVDVSASMVTRPETIEKAFGAVEILAGTFRVCLVCLDEALFVPVKQGDRFVSSNRTDGVYIYKKGDWKYIRSGNSGTTFFAPLFNRYMKRHREALIVITDGQIYDLPMLTPYPRTLWLLPGSPDGTFHPPFGNVIHLEEP